MRSLIVVLQLYFCQLLITDELTLSLSLKRFRNMQKICEEKGKEEENVSGHVDFFLVRDKMKKKNMFSIISYQRRKYVYKIYTQYIIV